MGEGWGNSSGEAVAIKSGASKTLQRTVMRLQEGTNDKAPRRGLDGARGMPLRLSNELACRGIYRAVLVLSNTPTRNPLARSKSASSGAGAIPVGAVASRCRAAKLPARVRPTGIRAYTPRTSTVFTVGVRGVYLWVPSIGCKTWVNQHNHK